MKTVMYLGTEYGNELTHGQLYDVISSTDDSMIIENDNKALKIYPPNGFVPSGVDMDIHPNNKLTMTLHGNIVDNTSFVEPKYKLGGSYNLRYLNDGLPNKILIVGYGKSISSDEWVYCVKMENLNNRVRFTESFIDKRISKMTADVYKLDVIKTRINNGMRWVGNYKLSTAQDKVDKLLTRSLVDCAYIREAYNSSGEYIPNKVSLWIKHKYPIYE